MKYMRWQRVHSASVPEYMKLFKMRRVKEEDKNQNLILFIRGQAISGEPSIRGIKKFPNPSIIKSIIVKKIIINALVTKNYKLDHY